MKIWYVSFQFYVRLHNNIQHSKWGDILLVFKRLKLYSTDRRKKQQQIGEIFTKYVYKYSLQSQFYHHVEQNFNREQQQQKSRAKRRMRAANIEKYFSRIQCSLLMFTRNCVLRMCHSDAVRVCMCAIYTDLGRSKQSFFLRF